MFLKTDILKGQLVSIQLHLTFSVHSISKSVIVQKYPQKNAHNVTWVQYISDVINVNVMYHYDKDQTRTFLAMEGKYSLFRVFNTLFVVLDCIVISS